MSVDRLGRGLEALIRPAEERKKVAKTKKSKKTPGANKISINQIKPNPNQPRQYFDDAALDDLAKSIKQERFHYTNYCLLDRCRLSTCCR